uniref:NADH-ubiquinone oxidoreductase chain 2 n=1 Tax=Yininemertes pratensis TaxID=2057967 RepID=A0A7U3VK20_9BILA|nr:NADH dehydrogenase subunit 2 [Yininemertes pratensis]QQP01068.1 NADH dehydrogenase subunit 2 [Yininemertes pratensis]
MVLSFPFSFGFGVLCVLGSLLSVSSGHWVGVWLGLEINLLGFIPLMVQSGGSQSVECAIKYFVVQALGSGFLLLGGLGFGSSFCLWFLSDGGSVVSVFLLFGLVLKLGVAPFHWWVPSVMGGLSWFGCGALLTWQKLAPFFVVLGLSFPFCFLFLVFGCFSAVVGGLMGVGQVQLRLLMAYSSISHWGWILSLVAFSFLGSLCYYFFYFLLSFFIFYLLSVFGLWRFSQVSGLFSVVLVFGFLSLGGLPPLTGFVPKWLGLQGVIFGGGVFVVGFLLLGSVLGLYYYLNFVFVVFLGCGEGYLKSGFSAYSGVVCVGLGFFCLGLPFYDVVFWVF